MILYVVLNIQGKLNSLKSRLKKFNLEIAEDKTKVIPFGRFAEHNAERIGKGKPETFDFLGFTHYCGQVNKGSFILKGKQVERKSR